MFRSSYEPRGEGYPHEGFRGGRGSFCYYVSLYLFLSMETISESQFQWALQEHDFIQSELEEVNKKLKPLLEYQSQLLWKQQKLETEYLLPTISISEINPKESTTLSTNNSITFPHLRAYVTYQFGMKRHRLGIYIGALSSFPNGREDKEAMTIAKNKAYSAIRRRHPEVFSE